MTAGAKPFEKTNRCCVTSPFISHIQLVLSDYWSSGPASDKNNPIVTSDFPICGSFLSCTFTVSLFLKLQRLRSCWQGNVSFSKTTQWLHTNICLFIHQWKLQSWRNLKRDSPRLSRFLCLMVKEWKKTCKIKINDENGLWFDPEQFHTSFLMLFKSCISSGSSPTIFGFYARLVESLLTLNPEKNFISEATFIFECLLFSILLSDKVLCLSRWL